MDENSFVAMLEESESAGQLSDEDMANYLNTNSSEYEIYTETNGN
jgi:hypothetical protein